MLCSVRATKSGPNWLDRLRSNKGFPACDNLDLDHFLKHNPTSSSESPNPNADSTPLVSNRPESSGPTRDAKKGEALLGLMSTAISELFFIDGSEESSRLSGKKVPRKQTHPRLCVTSKLKSSGSIGNDVNDLRTVPSLNSKNEVELEERGERELKGYSKSEVTVIDTSCEVWKTEKLVFRRKSVWKVREKKSKVRSFGRNKRKVVSGDEEGDDGIEEKRKKKKEAEVSDQCISLNPIENSRNDARKEVCKDATDNLNDRGKDFCKDNMPDDREDSEKGFPLKPRKTIKDGSSLVFIKGIPTDEKNEGKLPRKCLKDSQRKFKA
ncbi:PREDICTED: uncharacterized protein LOC101313650 [Fragaria vesca subsp. vesca]|uniref:uncharacterized protein LOC101313650 n=1 Tax=Fragaria vesca subsp. vesca TaxID=101020 RepID=UPI0002C2FACF|nr:PREDICTED: uncharacterized protein LOC101313650 [Fragaria vesca subsp. vesca]